MKKMMFNNKYELTQAVLDGRKTQTRRIAFNDLPDAIRCGYDMFEIVGGKELRCWNGERNSFVKLSFSYQVGEVVAVAQSYKDAGVSSDELIYSDAAMGYVRAEETPGWRNKLYTSAKLLPNRIRITRVWTERLQDISNEDCIKEGIVEEEGHGRFRYGYYYNRKNEGDVLTYTWHGFQSPKEAYASLVEKVFCKEIWERNPYVCCYEFEKI